MTDVGDLFEFVPCPLCGGGDHRVVYEARWDEVASGAEGGKVDAKLISALYSSSSSHELFDRMVVCGACGLKFLSPRPRADIITSGYSEAEDALFVSQNAHRIATFKKILVSLAKRFGLPKGMDILDIGCAGGAFLKAAMDLGHDPVGVEPNKWLCAFARDNYGAEVHTGILDDAPLTGGSFDLVSMWDVLEHVPDPGSVLDRIRGLLKGGGRLILTYPDIGGLIARTMGKRWPFLLSVHLTYFTRKTAAAMLEKHGFETELLRPYGQTLSMGYLMDRAGTMAGPLKGLFGFGRKCLEAVGLDGVGMRYYMSQTIVVSRKKSVLEEYTSQ
jgi:SAM-dependent methyltransferase